MSAPASKFMGCGYPLRLPFPRLLVDRDGIKRRILVELIAQKCVTGWENVNNTVTKHITRNRQNTHHTVK